MHLYLFLPLSTSVGNMCIPTTMYTRWKQESSDDFVFAKSFSSWSVFSFYIIPRGLAFIPQVQTHWHLLMPNKKSKCPSLSEHFYSSQSKMCLKAVGRRTCRWYERQDVGLCLVSNVSYLCLFRHRDTLYYLQKLKELFSNCRLLLFFLNSVFIWIVLVGYEVQFTLPFTWLWDY